jgi:transketolase
LTSSNLTFLRCSGDFQKNTPAGRYIRFGVREHAMIGICNGIFAHGALRPYCATFLNFLGYAFGSLRVAALSRFGIIMIMTHDSIGLGEDGPTHQPVEMLFSLRAMPNLLTIRPADGNEVNGAYKIAMEFVHTPTVISLSRQAAPTIAGTNLLSVALGAYVIAEFGEVGKVHPTIILIGTGTELIIALNTAKLLHSQHPTYYIRVVSMPCTELFDMQPMEYQLTIFTPGSPVMSIEAGGIEGWKKYAHAPFGLSSFGLSAPATDLYKHFGFTPENLAVRAQEVIVFYGGGVEGSHPMAPSLLQYPRFPVPMDVHAVAVGVAGNGHHR